MDETWTVAAHRRSALRASKSHSGSTAANAQGAHTPWIK
jgi:hypothetical protein